jgi:acetyl-CoA/propionyl-CoA carboxylase biotin carboxyl carrier protein
VRVDSGLEAGLEVSGFYDPLIAKLVVHGVDREHARRRMLRALDEYEIGGVETLLGFHRALLRQPCFVEAGTCHGIVESEELAEEAKKLSHETTTVTPASDGKLSAHVLPVELDGRRYDVRVLRPEPAHAALARARRERGSGHGLGGGAPDAVVSPMQGTVLNVRVADGDEVVAGDVLCIVEAMKMENEIAAHRKGVVAKLSVAAGESVALGQIICVVEGDGEPGSG